MEMSRSFEIGQMVRMYNPEKTSYKIVKIIGSRGNLFDVEIKDSKKIVPGIPSELLKHIDPLRTNEVYRRPHVY
jgi:hypothetical protein